jgi:insertion element IS1 protein InsB
MRIAAAAAVDDRWSCGRRNNAPRGLWHAVDHRRGTVVAYGFGRRHDDVLRKRKPLREPWGITTDATDSGGASTRPIEADQHQPGTRHTQQIERPPLTVRLRMTRLARQTRGVAKSMQMHDLVIGLFVNRSECG